MKDTIIHYADDDVDDLDLFKKAVERIGVKVSLNLYHNGDDFLESIKHKKSDKEIVFLDINMPGKSGLAVLKEMRETNGLKDMPVIMYSTSNDPNAISVSKEIGASLYVVKPSSFVTLKETIKKVLEIDWDKFDSGSDNFVFDHFKKSNG